MGEFLGADRLRDLDRSALPKLRHVVLIPIDKADGTWEEFVARGTDLAAADERAAAVAPDDVSDILFTSGTTGRSKGVLCAHRQSLAAPAAWAACGQLTSADRYLCINPFFHNFGYKAAPPRLPADGCDADPAADVRSGEPHASRCRAPHHRAARAADDLPD